MALLSNYISGGGEASGGAPSGKIIQMVTSEYVNNSAHITSTSSTTKVNSGLSATITPRDSSNNILVEFIATNENVPQAVQDAVEKIDSIIDAIFPVK